MRKRKKDFLDNITPNPIKERINTIKVDMSLPRIEKIRTSARPVKKYKSLSWYAMH